MINQETYLKEIEEQIQWFDKKSVYYKKMYLMISTSEIILSVLTPVFFTSASKTLVILAPFSAALVAMFSAVLRLFKCQENWISYRSKCQILSTEMRLYATQTQPYRGDQSFNHFVKRIEAILSDEYSEWRSVNIRD